MEKRFKMSSNIYYLIKFKYEKKTAINVSVCMLLEKTYFFLSEICLVIQQVFDLSNCPDCIKTPVHFPSQLREFVN